jgi:hypothetical protein
MWRVSKCVCGVSMYVCTAHVIHVSLLYANQLKPFHFSDLLLDRHRHLCHLSLSLSLSVDGGRNNDIGLWERDQSVWHSGGLRCREVSARTHVRMCMHTCTHTCIHTTHTSTLPFHLRLFYWASVANHFEVTVASECGWTPIPSNCIRTSSTALRVCECACVCEIIANNTHTPHTVHTPQIHTNKAVFDKSCHIEEDVLDGKW